MTGILFMDQVGYFLSPFDFLRELLTFFLFRVAFNRFVLFLRFMSLSFKNSSLRLWISLLDTEIRGHTNYFRFTSQIPETMRAVPATLERVTPSTAFPPGACCQVLRPNAIPSDFVLDYKKRVRAALRASTMAYGSFISPLPTPISRASFSMP
jgi:hypothetical protein